MQNDILPQVPSRRRFIGVAAAAIAAGSLSRFAFAQTSQTVTEITPAAGGDKTAIRKLRVHVPESQLTDLRRRIKATKWPERETVTDASQGVQLATMQKLATYWSTNYDWRKVEARLNALPQYVTEIDGLDIHFIHVRSKQKDALPMIITHGWPGSIIEQMKVIDPLTNPTAHGGSASDAFDVVIPSLPGYGFSGKPTATGWDPARIARAWVVLMQRLGYTRYVAQGGDWGNAVTEQMALLRRRDSSAFIRTCPPPYPTTLRMRSSTATRRPPVCRPMNSTPSINSTTSTSTVWVTRKRWRAGRKRCMASKIRLSVLPRGCSITTRRVRR